MEYINRTTQNEIPQTLSRREVLIKGAKFGASLLLTSIVNSGCSMGVPESQQSAAEQDVQLGGIGFFEAMKSEEGISIGQLAAFVDEDTNWASAQLENFAVRQVWEENGIQRTGYIEGVDKSYNLTKVSMNTYTVFNLAGEQIEAIDEKSITLKLQPVVGFTQDNRFKNVNLGVDKYKFTYVVAEMNGLPTFTTLSDGFQQSFNENTVKELSNLISSSKGGKAYIVSGQHTVEGRDVALLKVDSALKTIDNNHENAKPGELLTIIGKSQSGDLLVLRTKVVSTDEAIKGTKVRGTVRTDVYIVKASEANKLELLQK